MKKLLTLLLTVLSFSAFSQGTNVFKYLENKNVDTTGSSMTRVGQFWYNPTVGKWTFHDAAGYGHYTKEAWVNDAITNAGLIPGSGLTETAGTLDAGGTITQDLNFDGAFNVGFGQTTPLTSFKAYTSGGLIDLVAGSAEGFTALKGTPRTGGYTNIFSYGDAALSFTQDSDDTERMRVGARYVSAGVSEFYVDANGTTRMRITQAGVIKLIPSVTPAVGSALISTATDGTVNWGQLNLADADAITGNLPVTNIAPGTNTYVLTTTAGVTGWAAAAGGISGTLTSGRVTLGAGSSSVTDDADFTYNSGTNTLTVVTIANGAKGTTQNISNDTDSLATTKFVHDFALGAATSIADGYLLSTDWVIFNGKLANVLTTTGDIIYSSSGTTAARLAAGTATYVLTSNGAGVAPSWQAPSGGGGGSVFSGLTAATGTNTINNGANFNEWQWNTATASALKISSANTTATNGQKLLEIALSGANAGSGVTSNALYLTNTKTGTTSVNVAAYLEASGATNNYALLIPNGRINVGDGTNRVNFVAGIAATNTGYLELNTGVGVPAVTMSANSSSAYGSFLYSSGFQLRYNSGGSVVYSSVNGSGFPQTWNNVAHSATMTAFTWNQAINTGGSPKGWVMNGGAHTTLAASAEAIDWDLALNRTVTFATGAKTLQRAAIVRAPTYSAPGATVVATANTFTITGAPIAAGSLTITEPWALHIESGLTVFDDDVYLGTSLLGGAGRKIVATGSSSAVDFTLKNKGAANFYFETTSGNASLTPAGSATSFVIGGSAAAVVTPDLQLTANLLINTAGKGISIKEGSNARMGLATLSSGTIVVTTTAVTANSRIFVTAQTLGTITVPVGYSISARSAGTSFTILSGNLTDTSTVAWQIVEPL